MSSVHRLQLGVLARRSLVRSLRQPAIVVPSILFPLLLLAVNASGLARATDLPGFPTDNFLNFALAISFMQGALFATSNAGTDIARDVETGFLSRLSLTPVSGAALLVGLLVGPVAIGLLQVVVFVAVGLAFGATVAAGVGGLVVLVLLVLVTALGFSAIGAFFALRTGSGEAVQGLFPLLFVLLFLSSMNLPRNLISADWFRTVATYNPVSYLIEGMRSVFITGWDGEALALGFGLGALICVVGIALAARALSTRLVRT